MPPALANDPLLRLVLFVIGMAVVIGAAVLLYHLVEYPARRRLRNLFWSITAAASTDAPALASEALPSRMS